MSDIVDRLKAAGKPMALDDRVWNTITVSSGASIFDEAASTITALEARVKELEEALKPFADIGQAMLQNGPSDDSVWATCPDKTPVRSLMGCGMTFGYFRAAARTALGEKK